MTAGILDFGKDGAIVGRLKAPKAIKHYTWLMDVTIPHYNLISVNNTDVPTLDEFMVKVVIPEMMHKDSPRSHGAYFRIMRAMCDVTHKDELDRLAVQAKDAKHKDAKVDAPAPVAAAPVAAAPVAAAPVDRVDALEIKVDGMSTQLDMILQALTAPK